MSARGTLVVVVIGLLLAAALAAVAQQQPASNFGGRTDDRGQVRNPYFQPTPMPYQGSYTRRMQQKMQEIWGGAAAGRGAPRQHFGSIYGAPPREPVFVEPPDRGRCAGSRGCWRFYGREYPGWQR